MGYNYTDTVKDAEEKWGAGGGSDKGDWFKFEEGDNRVRLLTVAEPLGKHYPLGVCVGKDRGCPKCADGDKPSVKFIVWLIDRRDDKLKVAELPYSVMKTVGDIQNEPDSAFDEPPMPYDLNIKAKNAGTKEVEYSVIAARQNTPVPAEILSELAKQTTPAELIEKMKEKQAKKLGLQWGALSDAPASDDAPLPKPDDYNPKGKDYPEPEYSEQPPF